jgi:hypothetical protein
MKKQLSLLHPRQDVHQTTIFPFSQKAGIENSGDISGPILNADLRIKTVFFCYLDALSDPHFTFKKH